MASNTKAIGILLMFFVALFLQSGTSDAHSAASPQTWQGFVTDTHCGTNCQVTKDMKPDKKCIDRCVRKGSKYGLWVEHHVYELEPHSEAAQIPSQRCVRYGYARGRHDSHRLHQTHQISNHQEI